MISSRDSTIMGREKTRGSNSEGEFVKRKGALLEHSNHTITFLPAGRNQSTKISKRDVGHDYQQCCSKWQSRKTSATTWNQGNESTIESDVPLESEVPQLDEIASQPSEAANESHATTEEQTEIAKAAMNELNQKARRRNLRKEQKKAKKLEQMRNQAPILKQPARQTE